MAIVAQSSAALVPHMPLAHTYGTDSPFVIIAQISAALVTCLCRDQAWLSLPALIQASASHMLCRRVG